MAAMIGCWVAGTMLTCALVAENCSFAVVGWTAIGTLMLSLACERVSWYRERRRMREERPAARVTAQASPWLAAVLASISPWTESDEAILDGDLSLRAWRAAGQMRQRDSR